MDGLIVIDKPAGWTSHDAVGYLRGALGMKRVGHTGTLDPDATGVLLILIGRATRLARYFDGYDKEYAAVMRLGAETDTEDASGQVVRECPVPALTERDVLAVFEKFTGEISQTPPMFSAVKVGGRPLYKSARAGIEVARKPRIASIRSIELIGIEGPMVSFRAVCGGGTYIRTLCADMGRSLGTCAHMDSLRRTAVGRYGFEDALTLDGRPSGEEAAKRLIPLKSLLTELPAAVLSVRAAKGVKDGRQAEAEDILSGGGALRPGSPVRLMDEAGELLAVGEAAMEGPVRLMPRVVLV